MSDDKVTMKKVSADLAPTHDDLGYELSSPESKIFCDERPEIAGTKQTLAPAFRRITARELHERHGHIGVHPGCTLCQSVTKTTRKATHDVDSYRETRAGVFWVMDIFTPNVIGYNGMRYINVIGDVGSGFADVMHLERKSDLTEEFIKFVKNIRAMYGKDHDYELFQRVLLDSAGEQREDNAEFTAACALLGVTPVYGDPTRKTSMAMAEIRVHACAAARARGRGRGRGRGEATVGGRGKW
jgi:hypothetical protein